MLKGPLNQILLALPLLLCIGSCSSCGGSKDPNNIKLSSIVLSEGSLIPSFSAEITEYTAYVAVTTSQVTATISPEDEYASLKLNGLGLEPNKESLPEDIYLGSNTLTIEVTSANKGNTGTYTVTIIRKLPDFSVRVSSGDTTPSGNAEELGFSASIYGDTLVTGAPYYGATDTGIAYVFTKSGDSWSKSQTITPPVPAANDEFGYNVAVSEDTIAVSAPNEDTTQADSGVVYLYGLSSGSWTLSQTIKAQTPTSGGQFGYKVVISGDEMAISEPGANSPQPRCGNIHIYTKSSGTWTFLQTIDAGAYADANSYMGKGLALDGSFIAGGAPGNGALVGAVFLFSDLSGSWSLVGGVMDPELDPANEFGKLIALSGTTIAAGVPNGIYVCSSNSCSSDPIDIPDPEGLWLYDDLLIAGAPSYNGGEGAIYAVSQDEQGRWSLFEGPVSPDDVQADENFGKVIIGTDTGQVIIGSPLWNTTTVSDAGACYIME